MKSKQKTFRDWVMDEFGSLKEFQRRLREEAPEGVQSGNGYVLGFTDPWIYRLVDNPQNTPWRIVRLIAKTSGKSVAHLDKIIGEGEE